MRNQRHLFPPWTSSIRIPRYLQLNSSSPNFILGIGVGIGVTSIIIVGYHWIKKAHSNHKLKGNEPDEKTKDELIAVFQTITAEENTELCATLLIKHHWKIETAVVDYNHQQSAMDNRNNNSNNVSNNNSTGWIPTILGYGYSIAGTLLWPLSWLNWAELDPVAASHAFLRDLESKYGTTHPNFFEGGYQRACERAKADFRFLIVYLHSSLHENTPAFCRNTLCTPIMSEFINEHFLLWGSDLKMAEGYKISHVLGASTFPFLAVVCNNNIGGMTILDRIEGPMSPEELMVRLTTVLETHGAILSTARVDIEERDRNRQIREEQDVAFQQSLAEDQEKERRLMEEERRKRQEEEELRRQEELKLLQQAEKEKEKRETLRKLGDEPTAGDGVTQLVIRLTDGSRLQRRFYATDTLKVVFDYVNTQQSDVQNYDLVSNFPRKTFSASQTTLKEAGLYPHAALFVQEK